MLQASHRIYFRVSGKEVSTASQSLLKTKVTNLSESHWNISVNAVDRKGALSPSCGHISHGVSIKCKYLFQILLMLDFERFSSPINRRFLNGSRFPTPVAPASVS